MQKQAFTLEFNQLLNPSEVKAPDLDEGGIIHSKDRQYTVAHTLGKKASPAREEVLPQKTFYIGHSTDTQIHLLRMQTVFLYG